MGLCENKLCFCPGRICNESYMPHGLKVVQCCAKGGLRSLMQLERRWRQHFLECVESLDPCVLCFPGPIVLVVLYYNYTIVSCTFVGQRRNGGVAAPGKFSELSASSPGRTLFLMSTEGTSPFR